MNSENIIKLAQEYWEEQPDGSVIPVDPSEMQPAQHEPQSMALNAAMGYIKRHTPKLVHDEICKALRRPVMGASPQPAQQEPDEFSEGWKAARQFYTTPQPPAPVQQEPVAGVVLRDGQPTLLQDKHIKEADERLFRAAPPPSIA